MEIIYTDLQLNPLFIFALALAITTIILIAFAIKMLIEEDPGAAFFLFVLGTGIGIGTVALMTYCFNNPLTFVYARFNDKVNINELYEVYEEIQPYKNNLFRLLLK